MVAPARLLQVRRAMVVLAAGLLCLPAPTPAQTAQGGLPADAAPVARGAFEAGAPMPDWVDPPAAPAAGTVGPAAGAVVQVSDTQVHAGPPKTVFIRRVLHVRDAGALDQVGHVQTDFQPAFETLQLHQLEVVRGGTAVDHARTAPVRFLQREQDLEAGVYTGVTTASILVPDLRVGDTLRLALSIAGTHPVLGERLSQQVHWDTEYPIAWRRVTFVAPPGETVRWRWMGGDDAPGPAPEVEQDADGARRLRFVGEGLPPAPTESNLPADVEPSRSLHFSAWETWGEVARWAGALFPPDVPLPEEAKALVSRLQSLHERDAQVSQALQWVQREIRNWSIAFGAGSHRPRTPQEVLKRRYGDCKDKSWLLVRLLQELGVDARPVLLSAATRRGPADWLPSPEAFDHVIVRVRLDGREYYLDPTRQGQTGRLSRMGQVFEGAAALPVGEDQGALVTIRSPNLDEISTLVLSERFQIDRFDGDVSLETETLWTGAAAEYMRVAARRIDLARWRDIMLAEYGSRYPGLSLVGDPELLDDRVDNMIRLRGLFEVPRPVLDVGGGAWALPVMPANFRGSLTLPADDGRRFPLAVPAYPYRKRYEVEVVWPAVVDTAREPWAERLHTPHFAFDAAEQFLGRVQRRRLGFSALVPAVPVADLPRFVDDVRGLLARLGGMMEVRPEDCGGACRDGPASTR